MPCIHKVVDKSGTTRFFFECPGCGYAHAPDNTWTFNGDYDKPTFNPSLVVKGEFFCHSFIKDGKIEFLNDCTHSLKGQTVEIPNWNLNWNP